MVYLSKGETMNRNGRDPTIIKVGRLADGLSGVDVVQERMAVKVSGGRIEWVARQSELSQCGDIEGTVLDFPGATLMPGLIDCHTHTFHGNMPGTGLSVDEVHEDGDDIHLMEAVKSARMALESGVTTMRDNGGWNKVVVLANGRDTAGHSPGAEDCGVREPSDHDRRPLLDDGGRGRWRGWGSGGSASDDQEWCELHQGDDERRDDAR